MLVNYTLDTFLSIPSDTDVKIRIYNYKGELKYVIEPNLSFFYTKNNLVIIKLEDKNEILLDFSSKLEAVKAIEKINGVKLFFTNKQNTNQETNQVLKYSKSNLNMIANITTSNGSPALTTGITLYSIQDEPKIDTFIEVFINGVKMIVGGKTSPYDCYFSNDGGITAKQLGSERKGDYLYWNGTVAGFELDHSDKIDFIYLIN